MRVLVLLAAVFVASCATAQRGASLTGEWTGAYICAQRLTGLTLTINDAAEGQIDHALNATFAFSAHPENPGTPAGSFTMRGTFNPRDGAMLLWARDWLERPGDYLMVNLQGHLIRRGGHDHIAGHVEFPDDPSACTEFEVRRAPSTIASGGRDVQPL